MPKHRIDRAAIEERMASRQLNQSDLARALRVNRSEISKLLKGDRALQPSHMPTLAELLGVDHNWLIQHTSGLAFVQPRIRSIEDAQACGAAETHVLATLTVGPREPVDLTVLDEPLLLVTLDDGRIRLGRITALYGAGDVHLVQVGGNGQGMRVKCASAAKVRGCTLR